MSGSGYLVRPGEGEAVWSLGGHFTTKARAEDTDQHMALVEVLAWRSTEPPTRVLVLAIPAGFEQFARDLGVPATGTEPPASLEVPPPDVLGPIAERYGIEVVGPPLRSMGEDPGR